MIAAAAPPPPPVVAPVAVVHGRVTVRTGPRTTRLRVVLDGRAGRAVRVPRGPRRVSLRLPTGRWYLAVRAEGPGGARTSPARLVWVLPPSAARVGTTRGLVDPRLQADVTARTAAFPAVSGVYVQHLVTGCGAAFNAGAPFPAASTLKAAVLLDVVRRGTPVPGALLDRMLVDSDDRAANQVIASTGGGSPELGGARITETMRLVGMGQALVRRGYIIEEQARRRGRPIPVDARVRPQLFTNFVASPYELALLHVSLHRGSLGVGAVRRMGVGRARVRAEITRRLLEVRDRYTIVAGVPAGVPVAHKSGYTTEVKHDAGIVYAPSGPIVVSVMSWSASGVGDAAGNGMIADVTGAALRRLSGGGACRA